MDPIADFLTIIRNGYLARLTKVTVPVSKIKKDLASILKSKGYIEDFSEKVLDGRKILEITLSYQSGKPSVEHIKRISKPGLRVYKGSQKLGRALGGLGTVIVSTSQGVMIASEARKKHLGGEMICEVW